MSFYVLKIQKSNRTLVLEEDNLVIRTRHVRLALGLIPILPSEFHDPLQGPPPTGEERPNNMNLKYFSTYKTK